jgi:ATP-binding cassette, subfamily B, bacterial PglK
MIQILKKLGTVLDHHQKAQMVYLLLLMIVAAAFEAAGVGLVFSVVEMISRPDYLSQHPKLGALAGRLGITQRASLLLFSSFILITMFVFKNSLLAALQYFKNCFVYSSQVKLSRRLFEHYLYVNYISLLERNSVNILRVVNGDPAYIYQNIITSLLLVLSESLIIFSILAILWTVDPISILAALGLQGSIAALIYFKTKGRLKILGEAQQDHLNAMMKWVNQGLGGIKETKITGSQSFFLNQYEKHAVQYTKSEKYLNSLTQLPRLILETLAVSTFSIIVGIFIMQKRDLHLLAPTLAAFAMSAFRLLPAITRILTSLNLIHYFQTSIHTVDRELKRIPFERVQSPKKDIALIGEAESGFRTIEFDNISFTYPGRIDLALDHLSFKIDRNSTTAFVGQSGAGKTTLVDILLGLIEPTSGKVALDSVDIRLQLEVWQRRIGYVPQNIYLTDDSLHNNIAFGTEATKDQEELIWKVLEQVQLKEFVERLPHGLNTYVGDRGVKLSGGQRQRIGIARALFRGPDILVLDEATSSLDVTTEQEVMKAILGLRGKRTLLIVTHRLSTIKNSDLIYFLKAGRILEKGTFSEVVRNNSEFRAMAQESQIQE